MMALRLGGLLMVLGCGGAAPTVPPTPSPAGVGPGTASTAAPEVVPTPSSKPKWEVSWPAGLALGEGAVDVVLTPRESFVVSHSYGSEAEPFAIYGGAPGALRKTVPPWSCVASPAQLEANGDGVLVRCVDPKSEGANHFWFTADDGATWIRAGAIGEIVPMGQYALGGDTLFATGLFNDQRADLHVLKRKGTRFEQQMTSLKRPLRMQVQAMAASADGSQVALVFIQEEKLVVVASTDGGDTLNPVIRGESASIFRARSAAIHDGVLTVILEQDFSPRSIWSVSLTKEDDDPSGHKAGDGAVQGCTGGGFVVVSFDDGQWALSSDRGASFEMIDAPASTGAVSCNTVGARVGKHLLRWPR